MKDTALDDILNEIYKCFPFLLEQGFIVDQTNFLNDAMWRITFKSPGFSVEIASDRLELSFGIGSNKNKKRFDLFEIVYFLSQKKEFIGIYEEKFTKADDFRVGQMQRFAKILYRYWNQINVLFGENFYENEDNLQSVIKEVRELYYNAIDEKMKREGLL